MSEQQSETPRTDEAERELVKIGFSEAVERHLLKIARQLERENAELLRLLNLAAGTIAGLSDQQEMYDPWFEPPLAEIKAKLAELTPQSPPPLA